MEHIRLKYRLGTFSSGRRLQTKPNQTRLCERALRFVYKDYVSNFHELLEKDKSATIHNRSLRALVIEMYKIHHKILFSFIRNQ